MDPTRAECRWLAGAAWSASLVWFYIATVGSWGYTPGGLFWWVLLAGPLGIVTWRWMASAGTPISRRTTTFVVATGLLLLGLAALVMRIGDSPFGDRIESVLDAVWEPMLLVYALFPLLVTGWIVWRITRMRRARI